MAVNRNFRAFRATTIPVLWFTVSVVGWTISLIPLSLAQQRAWSGAEVKLTDLVGNDAEQGKFAYFFAAAMSAEGCHVAKVEGERGQGVFVRPDGKRGKTYADIAH